MMYLIITLDERHAKRVFQIENKPRRVLCTGSSCRVYMFVRVSFDIIDPIYSGRLYDMHEKYARGIVHVSYRNGETIANRLIDVCSV